MVSFGSSEILACEDEAPFSPVQCMFSLRISLRFDNDIDSV